MYSRCSEQTRIILISVFGRRLSLSRRWHHRCSSALSPEPCCLCYGISKRLCHILWYKYLLFFCLFVFYQHSWWSWKCLILLSQFISALKHGNFLLPCITTEEWYVLSCQFPVWEIAIWFPDAWSHSKAIFNPSYFPTFVFKGKKIFKARFKMPKSSTLWFVTILQKLTT